jgi:small subunit ribosomal protein S1
MARNDDPNSFSSLFEAAPNKGAPRRVRIGEVLDLEVVRTGKTEVFVALDGKQEGFILADELLDENGESTVRLGSRVAARVIEIQRDTGSIRLTPVSSQPIVDALSGAATPQATGSRGSTVVAGMRVKGKVTGVERYGVFVEFPVTGESRPGRGLVPVAELGSPRGADLRKAFPVGTEMEAAVVAIDERGRIRLSVIALNVADERKAFETFTAGAKEPNPGDKNQRERFGTFADLLKKKK